jgi:hypothetical protein
MVPPPPKCSLARLAQYLQFVPARIPEGHP